MPRQDTYKPNVQEMEQESLIYLSTSQQPPTTVSLGHSTQKQPCPAVPDRHGKEEENKTTEQGVAEGVPTSMDTGGTSVPQNYDAQKGSEQVLQGGTEAMSKAGKLA